METLEWLYENKKEQLPGDAIALYESGNYAEFEVQSWTYHGYRLNGRRTFGDIFKGYTQQGGHYVLLIDNTGWEYRTLEVELFKKVDISRFMGQRYTYNHQCVTVDFDAIFRSIRKKHEKEFIEFVSKSRIDKEWFRGIASRYLGE